jgi:hypothetical protein
MGTRLGRKGSAGRRNLAGLLVVALASIIGVSVYAFTASNTVASHSAGAGSATVSGYTVASPTNYVFNGEGTTMEGVTFDLDKPASDVQVALTPAAPAKADWTDCGASEAASPYAVTCTFNTAVPVAEGLKLSVAAVSSGTVSIE